MGENIRQTISSEEFHNALATGQFHTYFQPKIDMVTSKLCGVEALSRWIHPASGMRFPNDYIPQLEESGMIKELDMYILESVCKAKAEWKKKQRKYADIVVSVNMSRMHLFDDDFAVSLSELVDKYRVSHEQIEIEITENVFVDDVEGLVKSVESVKEQGFFVSIDDFGSGFSGLNLLKDISVDTIKIDKEFLHGSGSTERGKSIIKNIIALCLDLKVDAITEGVETVEQIEFIKKCGCKVAQGFYYSKPIPMKEFEEFADKYIVPSIGSYVFDFEGNTLSDDGSYEGIIEGEGFIYNKGVYGDVKSLRFPGGPVAKNVVFLPKEILVSESYGVSLWMKPEELSEWTSVFYIRYDIGFLSIAPLTDKGTFGVRWWNSKGMDGWYDIYGPKIQKNYWIHVFFSYNARKGIMSAYINGELIGMLDNVPTNRYVEEIIVGGDNFKPSFVGNIDDVIIYNEAKDEKFVKKLYDEYTSMPINNYERI